MARGSNGGIGYQLIYSMARWKLLRSILIWGIAHMQSLVPKRVISETESLICFYHPRPKYAVHILLVPKEEIRDLLHLDPNDNRFLRDLFATASKLVEELGLQNQGYRLVLNGGEYQEFPQLHFHLISED